MPPQPLSPTDIPLPGLRQDPGVRPATRPVMLPQTVDPTGQAIGQVADQFSSAQQVADRAQRSFQADLDSISGTFKQLADKRQAAENAAFVDRFKLEFAKRSSAIQAEAVSGPDTTKPDFVSKLDQRLSEAQADVLKQLRENGGFSPSDEGVKAATTSAMETRTATARASAITAHNQRLGLLVDSATQNVLQIGRDAAATGDLQGGIDKANATINSLEPVLEPTKFQTLKRAARENTTEMVVRGYIERGEYDKARSIVDQNRAFTGTDAVVADVARRSGLDPALLVAIGRAESSGNPNARAAIDPRTGKPYSTSSGLFGFTSKTAQAYGLPTDAASASLEEQTRAAAGKLKDDQRALKAALGQDPNAGQLYLAWFLGAGDAAKVLKANPATPIAGLIDARAIQNNSSILGGKTAGDVIDWAAVKMVSAGAGGVVPGAKFVDNAEAAQKALNLSGEEQALYQRHLKNLYGTGGVDNPDGSRSTLFATTIEQDGKTYLIPTVWDGKILSADEASARAAKTGLDKFPSYASEQEAQARYAAIHQYIDRDTASFYQTKKAQAGADIGRFLKEDTRVQLLNTVHTQQHTEEDRANKRLDRQIKLVGEAYLREIYRRAEGLSIDQRTNEPIPLTSQYIDSVRQYLSPTEYKGAMALARGGGAEDDMRAVIDLTTQIDQAQPEEFQKAAVAHLEANRLTTKTFTSLVEKNRSARKDDQPASPYKIGKTYVEQALDPGFLSGPAQQPARMARANAIVEYENWIAANPTAGRADALNQAANIASRYLIINTNEMKLAIGSSPYFGAKARNAVTLDDVAMAERGLYADMQSKKITREQAEVEIRRLNNWRSVLQREQAAAKPLPKGGIANPTVKPPMLGPGEL